MDNDRSYIEEHARHIVRVASILFASHNTIEYNPRVWKTSALDNTWTDAPSIRSIGRTEMRVHDILRKIN
jgi:hypothetical protein